MVPLRTARNALIELLDQNDNTDNKVFLPFLEKVMMADDQYSDCSYTATLISALGNMLGSATDNRAATAIEKAITLDRLLPSFGNVVTKAGLEVGS
jgi:transcription initiation factor TFIID subunit 2